MPPCSKFIIFIPTNNNFMNSAISVFCMACLFFLFSCNRQAMLQNEAPVCIKQQIELIESSPPQSQPVEIWKWTNRNGKVYYYITSPCCDQYNYIHDTNCQEVCAPDGGENNLGDGNCPDLEENVTQELVWKDDRNYIARSTQEDDRKALEEQFATIRELANSNECVDAANWKIAAYGSKACGGPQGHLAYSKEIDEDYFLELLADYKQAERAYNEKYNIVSDCMVVAKPETIVCEEGKAVLQ